jgi:glutamine amidotransferase
MNQVVIVDYGMCNLDSVARAVEECGGKALVSSEPTALSSADRIILPGVGSFADGMDHIRKRGWDVALDEYVLEKQTPLLGICLGMQLMAKKGWEGGETAGLGWIDGEVVKLTPTSAEERIPHVGWNEIQFNSSNPLFQGLGTSPNFYFVHSYHFSATSKDNVIAQTPYCGTFASAVGRKNIWGVQFHPEKSQKVGFRVIQNFLSI